MHKPLDEWKEFIPERKFLLETVRITKSKILIEYLVNACSEVVTFDYEGKETGKIPLPPYSTLAGISSRKDEEEFFYGVETFVFPKIVYRYDPSAMDYLEWRRTDNPIQPDDYVVKQEWYVSKDGTKVSMFVFHKKGLTFDESNPTILYGYGGFAKNETPLFMRNWVPWIERGGIFAVANIRGGGEFGEQWHKDGIKENKQNSFDDFIAAGEYLISQKYTNKGHLGILGVSNGGLLVSAVAVERPDLFNAVCARVPLTDMVRFPKFGIAMRWIHEYGNPDIVEDLKNILKWSPYHNVREGIEYPNFLFTTANKDTRVDPLHARKMTARLQEVNKKNEVLLYTEMDAGHGAGKPIVKIVESQALVISFFAGQLDLKI
jgi:prolyl oligopeptidase